MDNRTWDEMAMQYQVWMELVAHPERGSRPMLVVVCTPEQADAKVGQLYSDNPAWRITKMLWIGFNELVQLAH